MREKKKKSCLRKRGSGKSKRRKKPWWRRVRHWYRKNKKQAIYSLLFCLGISSILGILVYREQMRQRSYQVTADNGHDTDGDFRKIEYKGERYEYNSQVRLVLYAGVDGTGKMEATAQYGNKSRADTIFLLILDNRNKKISVLSISRDTITEIRKYTRNGNDNGLYSTQLGYAYAYGDGGKASCLNLCEGVSRLLGGIPVRTYLVTNQDSMPYVNRLAGGVTVTVPNEDLEEIDPEFISGNRVTLTDDNVKTFLQYRNTEEDFSNEGRMARQKAYAAAYIEKMRQMTADELTEAWDSMEEMEGLVQTSISREEYLDLASLFRNLDFSDDSIQEIPGENQTGELHDEFHPDPDALQEQIIELFYEKERGGKS